MYVGLLKMTSDYSHLLGYYHSKITLTHLMPFSGTLTFVFFSDEVSNRHSPFG